MMGGGEVVTSNANDSSQFYERNEVARSNYLFSTGGYNDYSANYNVYRSARTNLGAFGNDGAARFADIKDGSSNTIVVGESRQYHTSTAYGPYWGAGTHTCCHGYTPLNNVRFHINVDYYADGSGLQYAWQFGSTHTGGAHFLMGDGAVRFISENIDYVNVFQWLNRIKDGNVTSEF